MMYLPVPWMGLEIKNEEGRAIGGVGMYDVHTSVRVEVGNSKCGRTCHRGGRCQCMIYIFIPW